MRLFVGALLTLPFLCGCRLAKFDGEEPSGYARVASYQFDVNKLEEAAGIYEEQFLPAAKRQKGFKRGMLLTNPKTGKALGITVWATKADAIAFEGLEEFKKLAARLEALQTPPPIREEYDVSAESEAR